jgi:hypothetical protein
MPGSDQHLAERHVGRLPAERAVELIVRQQPEFLQRVAKRQDGLLLLPLECLEQLVRTRDPAAGRNFLGRRSELASRVGGARNEDALQRRFLVDRREQVDAVARLDVAGGAAGQRRVTSSECRV